MRWSRHLNNLQKFNIIGGSTSPLCRSGKIQGLLRFNVYNQLFQIIHNETVRRQQTNAGILSAQGIAQAIMDFEVRMGEEIRVEFTVTASLVDVQGNAMVDGEVKLYEGASESTGDLDGQRQFQLYCPKSAETMTKACWRSWILTKARKEI
jgi:hypothetical protein